MCALAFLPLGEQSSHLLEANEEALCLLLRPVGIAHLVPSSDKTFMHVLPRNTKKLASFPDTSGLLIRGDYVAGLGLPLSHVDDESGNKADAIRHSNKPYSKHVRSVLSPKPSFWIQETPAESESLAQESVRPSLHVFRESLFGDEITSWNYSDQVPPLPLGLSGKFTISHVDDESG